MLSTPQSNTAVAEAIDDAAYRNLDMRGTQAPVPTNLQYFLTDVQLDMLHNLEAFGWRLAFVRRPLFELSTVVIESPEHKQFATIDEDGSLNLEPDLHLRLMAN